MTTTPTPPISPTAAIYCRHCGYDLRATPPDSPRCPECGRVFDPSNPRTFRRRPLRRWLRRWLRHVKRAAYSLLTLTLLLAAIWLWFFWGWYEEQQALAALHAVPLEGNGIEPLSPWLRDHVGSAGFVLDRVVAARTQADSGSADLAPVARLKELSWLRLRGSAITDVRPLAACTQLKTLSIEDTAVADVTPLAKLTRLEKLSLPPNVTDLTPLAGLTNLTFLWFVHSGVTDLTPLARLTKLEQICLADTRVKDLRPLMQLKSLLIVDLPQWTITEEQAEELRRALPECTVLRF